MREITLEKWGRLVLASLFALLPVFALMGLVKAYMVWFL